MAPIGRPRKVSEPANPDDKVATRGYVKCIARKLHDHNHTDGSSYIGTGLAAMFLWMILIIVWIATLFSTTANPVFRLPEWAYWILVASTLIETISVYDSMSSEDEYTGSAHARHIEDYIKKYEIKKDKEC